MDKHLLLKLAGLAQIALCFGSLMIPKMLNWKGELKNVSTIISQIFWTYAAYILLINFGFGIISVLGSVELYDGSFQSKSIAIFIFLYWLGRVLIQFFYFDTKSAPQGTFYKLGEITLILLFISLTLVYGYVVFVNFQWIYFFS